MFYRIYLILAVVVFAVLLATVATQSYLTAHAFALFVTVVIVTAVQYGADTNNLDACIFSHWVRIGRWRFNAPHWIAWLVYQAVLTLKTP
jgi:hypothetical protein